ncbi:hypothetical protein [Vibrio breoganii]|uniref:hypothetical protein n=1 Tax=Vibrio breoganii TaxID=553239 RepID=UPI000C84D9AF|nr:hypothetical protein [Vibrio breoganii]PMK20455.1 hypothetical protein BCU06_06700 [Vibrio breoganii]
MRKGAQGQPHFCSKAITELDKKIGHLEEQRDKFTRNYHAIYSFIYQDGSFFAEEQKAFYEIMD